MREPEAITRPNGKPHRRQPNSFEEKTMLRKSLFLAVSLVVLAVTAGPAGAANGALYKTEAEAVQACTGEPVVWLKLDAHLYFRKDQDGYGGNDGLYACEKGARKAGYFAAK
jgi:hypothetical protein